MSVSTFSKMLRSPRAPVFVLFAIFAIRRNASSSNVKSTPSIYSILRYCLIIEFCGSVRIRTKSSSDNGFVCVITGKRPISSGISPNFFKSSWRTLFNILIFFSSSLIIFFVLPNPIGAVLSLRSTILSIPSKAPMPIKRIFVVSISINCCSGCLRPPFGGTPILVPSTILSRPCCTPSPPTSRVNEAFSPRRPSLSISSKIQIPDCALNTSPSAS